MTQLSIVVPVYNEEESLEALHAEICEVVEKLDAQIELLFIDDGSTDSSWSIITKLAREDKRIRAFRFRRNFGKAAALDVGLHAPRHDDGRRLAGRPPRNSRFPATHGRGIRRRQRMEENASRSLA